MRAVHATSQTDVVGCLVVVAVVVGFLTVVVVDGFSAVVLVVDGFSAVVLGGFSAVFVGGFTAVVASAAALHQSSTRLLLPEGRSPSCSTYSSD